MVFRLGIPFLIVLLLLVVNLFGTGLLFRNRLTPNRLFAAGCGRRACFLCFFIEIPKI